MNTEIQYVILNALLYVFFFVFLLLKRKESSIGKFILGIWSIAALSSIFYYIVFYHSFVQSKPITLIPFLYLFIANIIFFFPAISIKCNQIQHISGDYKLMRIIAIGVVTLNILPFSENLIYCLTHLDSNSSIADNYGEVEGAYLSDISKNASRYSSYLRIIAPVMLFFFLQFYRKNRLLFFGILISVVNPILGSLNNGSRFTMVVDVLYLFTLFLLFRNVLDEKVKRKIYLYGIGCVGALIALFILITVLRYNGSSTQNSLLGWISLYSGESFLNFNTDMWTITKNTNGANSFPLFKYWLGEYPTFKRDWIDLERKVPIRMNVFYTFIGDFYVDFGRTMTIIIVLSTSFFFKKVAKNIKTITPIYIFILFGIYLKICISGFTYYTYVNGGIVVVYTLLIVIIIYFFQNKSSRKLRKF